MSRPLQVSATQFSRSFARYREEVHAVGVIEVTSHDRVVGGYLSPKELEHYRRLKLKEREAVAVEDIDDELLNAIKNAKYGEVSE